MSQGIDYGLGRTNVNRETGIRYGVISQHSMADWFFDSFEADYGQASCPVCGNEAEDASSDAIPDEAEDWENYSPHGCNDYACKTCAHYLDSGDAFGDEPIGHTLDEDGIHAESCLDSDVIVTASPFFTYGPFCSPCVPGAINLDSATGDDYDTPVKAYCFPHDWFEGRQAPYRVFRVDDNTEVFPEITPIGQDEV